MPDQVIFLLSLLIVDIIQEFFLTIKLTFIQDFALLIN